MTELDNAFFHRRGTHQMIRALSKETNWTIYAGLGVSIDRTGLSWDGLVGELLIRFIRDANVRRELEKTYNPIQRSTILNYYYNKIGQTTNDSDRPLRELRDDLRSLLYTDRRLMGGNLSKSIADLATHAAIAEGSAVVVTPNYDEYLYQDIEDSVTLAAGLVPRQGGIRLVAVDKPSTRMPAGWNKKGAITCVHIHGLVASRADEDKGKPVLSEGDYAEHSGRSQKVLEQLLRGRQVLLVGTSLTDAPLVAALLATQAEAAQGGRNSARVALLPGQDPSRRKEGKILRWNDDRLAQLGVKPVYPDFYIQVAQFVHEIQKCLEIGDGDSMTEPFSPRRYGNRLISWWAQWFEKNCQTRSTQEAHHQILVDELEKIRDFADVPLEENLKLEVWVRWQPASGRQLALWASSVGTWDDPYAMKIGKIESDSRYRAVQIFCNGAPTFLAEEPDSMSRWRSHFGTPIWHETTEGRVPVGIVLLSSMLESEIATLNVTNVKRLDQGVQAMRSAGRRTLVP